MLYAVSKFSFEIHKIYRKLGFLVHKSFRLHGLFLTFVILITLQLMFRLQEYFSKTEKLKIVSRNSIKPAAMRPKNAHEIYTVIVKFVN